MEKRNWIREEFILVMNLYTKIPYGQFHSSNPEVKKLAALLDRTPGAVAYKLVHFSGLDPYHKSRGIKGLANPGNKPLLFTMSLQRIGMKCFTIANCFLQNIKIKVLKKQH